jgi:hypothetical protein
MLHIHIRRQYNEIHQTLLEKEGGEKGGMER